MKIVKNKLAPPFKTAQFELEFGKGISRESELINLGVKHKFITKSGSFYNYNGQNFHGKDAIRKFLAENCDAQEELTMKLREELFNAEIPVSIEMETETVKADLPEEIISPETTDEDAVSAAEA